MADAESFRIFHWPFGRPASHTGYSLASQRRRAFYQPGKILAGHVRRGMTVLEPGLGLGFFTLDLARLDGDSGRVIAVEVQQRMLEGLRRRAAKAGLLDRLDNRQAAPVSSWNGSASKDRDSRSLARRQGRNSAARAAVKISFAICAI